MELLQSLFCLQATLLGYHCILRGSVNSLRSQALVEDILVAVTRTGETLPTGCMASFESLDELLANWSEYQSAARDGRSVHTNLFVGQLCVHAGENEGTN